MCLCLRNTKYSDNGSVNETFFFPGQPALNLKSILLPKKKDPFIELLQPYSWGSQRHVLSNGRVSTATSSDVPCQLHRDREENVSNSLGLWWSEDGALSSCGTCGRPPQHCTNIVCGIPVVVVRPPSCRWPADPLCFFSPGPARLNHRVLLLRMDPAVLIFLLYVMIAHELFCGWMHYRRQRNKSRKAAGPMLRSRCVWMCVPLASWWIPKHFC